MRLVDKRYIPLHTVTFVTPCRTPLALQNVTHPYRGVTLCNGVTHN
jgi:hypothetical protein